MYNILGTSVPQDKANTHHHARFLPVSNSFDRVCLRCNLTLFTRRIKSCTSMRYLYPHFRKEIFIDAKIYIYICVCRIFVRVEILDHDEKEDTKFRLFFFFMCKRIFQLETFERKIFILSLHLSSNQKKK